MLLLLWRWWVLLLLWRLENNSVRVRARRHQYRLERELKMARDLRQTRALVFRAVRFVHAVKHLAHLTRGGV